jgi:hypothetical protein
MPSFTVTAAGQRVSLGISGTAQASFTVTNTSTQTLKGRMLPKPTDSASPDWFSIVGETVRDFGPNEAEQVVVQLQVPQTAPPGAYSFRLDAVSAVDPDEDFTEGPTVAFDVEAQPPPKKGFPWVPWWILAIVGGVVLLIIIGVVVFLLVRGGDKVVSSGNGTIPANSLFDVDTGTAPAAGGPGADIRWIVFGQLRAMGPAAANATLVNIGVVDFDDIDAEQLSKLNYGSGGIPAHLAPNLPNELVTGDVFAVHSGEGNFAKIKVVSPDNQFGIQWVTYRLED